ncbi:MAG: hypothetical protein MJA82_21505 [Clostridia bacterium]|nr:hypothetical protein [Clostridia bacterium]
MKLLNLFNKKVPWENREPIYIHIRDNIDENGNLTTESLPDEEIRYKDTGLRWVAGALDGAFGHHASCSENDIKLAKLTESIALYDRKKDKIEFYNIVIKDNIVSSIDSLIEEIVKLQVKITQKLYNWIEFLTFQSPDRGAVKTGIALLGAMGATQFKDQIKILGRHEEFTLYVVVALLNMSDDPEIELWELAKRVHGWGRIHIVERLAETENPEIKSWILTEGYKNNIMYEYLAYIAADTGDLKKVLSKDNIEDDILLAASDIIQALIAEGPVPGISIYQDAAETVKLYIKHTLGKRDNLSYLLTYDCIYDYVTDTDTEWDNLKENGWDEEKRNEIAKILREELENETWKELIIKSANTENDVDFWIINRAAKILNINLFNVHWERIQKDPLNQTKWFDIMNSATNDNIDAVLEYAIKTIPLAEISTGADELIGLGKEYNLHSIVSFIVQSLDKYEGKGKVIILAALKSPVIRNRNMAIRALDNWNIEYITQELKDAINDAEKIEPKEDVKERLSKLLTKF